VTITKAERNLIFTAIKDAGLDPHKCRLTKNDSRNLKVEHSATRSYIDISQRRWIDKDRIWVMLSVPRLSTSSESALLPDSYLDWGAVIIVVRNWAGLVLELETLLRQQEEKRRSEDVMPDLWTLPPNLDMPESEEVENTPFSPQEQETIAKQLREIKKYVKANYELADAKFARIEERLDEAEWASRRMGRKDWFLLFGGVVLTLIVNDLVPQTVVEGIYNSVIHSLGHLFGGPQRRGMIET
jgi:hypothetical protein